MIHLAERATAELLQNPALFDLPGSADDSNRGNLESDDLIPESPSENPFQRHSRTQQMSWREVRQGFNDLP